MHKIECKLGCFSDIPAERMEENRFYIVTKNSDGQTVNFPVIKVNHYLSFPQSETWARSMAGYRVRPLMAGESIIIEG